MPPHALALEPSDRSPPSFLVTLRKRAPQQPGILPIPTPVKPKPKPVPTTINIDPLPGKTSTLPATPSASTSVPKTKVSTVHTSTTATPSPGSDGEGVSSEPSGTNTGLIVGVTLGVVAVIALVGLLLFRRRRNQRRGAEVREAELYQQQRMMRVSGSMMARGDTHGRGQHRRAGSSLHGLMSGGRTKVSGEAADGEGGSRENAAGYHGQNSQHHGQPDWFAKKKPLEYYRQVPPIEELIKNMGRRDWSSTRSDLGQMAPDAGTTEATAARGRLSSAARPEGRAGGGGGESIPLHATITPNAMEAHRDNHPSTSSAMHPVQAQQQQEQQQQYSLQTRHDQPRSHQQEFSSQNNRLSPIRPISPMGSVYYSRPISAVYSRPSPDDASPYYRPPPPPPAIPERPDTQTPRGSSPSPGFYDFIPLESDQLLLEDNARVTNNPSSSASPPPIPRATRPTSILAGTFPVGVKSIVGLAQSPYSPLSSSSTPSTSSTQVSDRAPVPPLNMKVVSSGAPVSPASPSESDMSSLSAGDGPARMGGRKARVNRAKRRTLDTAADQGLQ
ncbi:unnamed protein product [Mortierella alpina]